MNQGMMQQAGPGGMPPQQMPPGLQPHPGPPMNPQGGPPQQGPPQQQQRQEERLISKARELVGPLKSKWSTTLKVAASNLNTNSDTIGANDTSAEANREKFETHLEDFYQICDQIELNLKSAVDCLNQTNAGQRYMPIPPHPSRMDSMGNDFLPYGQYLATSKQQVNFANDVKNLLNQAAEDVVRKRYSTS